MADNEVYDSGDRLLRLIDKQDPIIAAGFTTMVAQVKSQATLKEIADLLERRLVSHALDTVLRAAPKVGEAYIDSFVAAGQNTARFLGQSFETIIMDFDRLNPWAVNVARENQLRLVREFTQGQVRATHEALLDGMQRGLNPRAQARAFRDSIGLTQSQVRAVNNYRAMLTEGDSTALQRALRDKRFDRTVARAIEEGTPLKKAQIDRMVGRYNERMLKYRSEVIGRTESLRAVHQGNDSMYRQAIENGDLDKNNLDQTWESAADRRVRDSHAAMNQQMQPFGEPFLSGLGNQLMYPGDPGAPAEDTVQCRCTLGTRIREVRAPEGMSVEVIGF